MTPTKMYVPLTLEEQFGFVPLEGEIIQPQASRPQITFWGWVAGLALAFSILWITHRHGMPKGVQIALPELEIDKPKNDKNGN